MRLARLVPAVLIILSSCLRGPPDGHGGVGAHPGAATTPAPGASVSGPICHGHAATIVGTPGNDVIHGTQGPDVIVGLGGDDVIFGLGGMTSFAAGRATTPSMGGMAATSSSEVRATTT